MKPTKVRCSKCERRKLSKDFYSRNGKPKQPCKSCHYADHKARRQRKAQAKQKVKRFLHVCQFKWCSRCGRLKTHKDFGNMKATWDQKKPHCKPCNAAQYRNWYYSDPAKGRSVSKNWRDKNPGKRRDAVKKWCDNNRDYINMVSAIRRSPIINDGELVSIEEILQEHDNKCNICGQNIDLLLKHPDRMSLSIDHIKPLILGGTHTKDNVAPTHLSCNAGKRDSYENVV